MPHQPSFLGNSRTCSNAVISTYCQDKFAIRCLLADSLKNLLAAFADGIAVFHLLHVRWITLRVSRRRGGGEEEDDIPDDVKKAFGLA